MFETARPVWAKGLSKSVNRHLSFTIPVPEGAEMLRISGATAYQIFLDDSDPVYGPARTGLDHARVDELSLAGIRKITVRAAGYYTASFQACLSPSFLCAEILDGAGRVLWATGTDPVTVREDTRRIRKTDRYARQRYYTEVYDLTRPEGPLLETEEVPTPVWIARGVRPFSNRRLNAVAAIADFSVIRSEEPELPSGIPFNEQTESLNPELGLGPSFEDTEYRMYPEVYRLSFPEKCPVTGDELKAGTARLYDLGADLTGIIDLELAAEEETELMAIYEEILQDGDIVPVRSHCLNCIRVLIPAGRTRFLSFEPYTMRYLKLCVLRGAVTPYRVGLLECAGSEIALPRLRDPELDRILRAAASTFRQNATDIFMDCPSRERAGWLCDSFFTARTEYALTGESRVEHNFLENFTMTDGCRYLGGAPEGMLPMCWPSSHDYIGKKDNYIVNWALWLILQTEEYAFDRHGDPELVRALEKPLGRMLDGLKPWEEEHGLIRDMPGWVFIEWSRANDPEATAGINWPSNMLYASALCAYGHLYGRNDLSEKGLRLKALIREKAFNGRFFADNTVTGPDGTPVFGPLTTEACQYYAAFFGISSAGDRPEWADTLMNDFGPERKKENRYPDVPFANAFIGNYLRLEVLRRTGRKEQLLREIRGYFAPMAERTGTLWEHDSPSASCCHGFASHVAVWLMELVKDGVIEAEDTPGEGL